MTAPLTANTQTRVCDMCFDREDPVAQALDPGSHFITCIKCKATVHVRCYGDANSFDAAKGEFTCGKCQASLTSIQSCFICLNNCGFIKQLDSGKWVHPICALCSNDTEIDDYYRMNYSIIGYSFTYPVYSPLSCAVCASNKGHLLFCSHKACRHAVHPHCAFLSRAKYLKDDPKSTRGWQIQFDLTAPDTNGAFPELWRYLQGDPTDIINLVLNNIAEPEEYARCTQGKFSFPVLMGALDSARRKAERKFRGGNIRVMCEDHKNMRLQCVCGNKPAMSAMQKNFLVCCSCCDTWFHSSCIGLTLDSYKQMRTYVCTACCRWQTLKTQFLLSEGSGKREYSPEELGENEWRVPLYCPGMSALKITDLLLIGSVWTRRAKLLLGAVSKTTLLYAHIMHSTAIPICCDTLRGLLERKLQGTICFELSLQSNDMQYGVQSIMDATFRLKEDSVKYNERIGKVITEALTEYESHYKTTSQYCKMLRSSKDLLDLLGRCQQSASGKPMSYKEAASVLQELEQLVGNKDDFKEILYLQKHIALALAWNSQVYSSILNVPPLAAPADIPTGSVRAVSEFVEHAKKSLCTRPEKQSVTKLIEDANKLSVVPDEGIRRLEEELQRLSEWEKSSSAAETDLIPLVGQLLQLKIRPEGDVRALETFEAATKWGIILDGIVTKGLKSDLLTGTLGLEPVSLRELEETIQAAAKLPVPPKKQLQAARELKQEIDSWLESFAAEGRDRAWTTDQIKGLLQRGEKLRVRLQEIETLRDRLQISEALEALPRAKDKLSADHLKALCERARKLGFPDVLLRPLDDLSGNARSMAMQAKLLVEAQSLFPNEYKNIVEIYALLQRAQDSRVVLSDLSGLYQITFAYEWYGKVIKRIQGAEPTYSQLERLDLTEIQTLLQDTNAIQPLTGPAVLVQGRLLRIVWAKRAKECIERGVMAEDTFATIVKDMELCEAAAGDGNERYKELCVQIKRTKEEHATIESECKEITGASIEEVSAATLESLLIRTRKARELAAKQRIKFGDYVTKLEKYETFLSAYKSFLLVLNGYGTVSCGQFATLYDQLAQIAPPGMKCLAAAQAELQAYRDWTAQYQDYVVAKTSQNPAVKKAFDLATLQRLVSDAAKVIPHISLEGRLEALQNDVLAREKLENTAGQYISAVKSGTPPLPTVDDIIKLIESLGGLEISSETLVADLKICRWMMGTRTLWETRKCSLEDWNSQLNDRHFLLVSEAADEQTKKLLQSHEVDEITDSLREATQLGTDTKALLADVSQKKPQSPALLQSMLERIASSHVDFAREADAINAILKGAQKVEDSLGQLRNGRADIADYEKLRTEIAQGGILMPHVENELTRILLSARQFDKRVENARFDAGQRKMRLSYRVAEDLLKDYGRLQFRTPEGEGLKDTYATAMRELEDARGRVEAMKVKAAPMDEIMQVADRIKKLPIDMGNEETKLQADLWRIKHDGLVTHNDRLEYKPLQSALKGLVSEAEQLRELSEPADREKVGTLNSILSDSKRDINRIFNTFSNAELSALEKQLQSRYIDYSEFIIEQRTRLSLRSTAAGKRDTSEQSAIPKDPRPRRRLKPSEPELFPTPQPRPETGKSRRRNHVQADVRCKCKAQLISSFRTNPAFESLEKAFERAVDSTEDLMFKDYETDNDGYLRMEAKLDKIVGALKDHPHTTRQIAEGKLPLYRLCRVGDSQRVLERVLSLERALERKQSEQEKEASNRELRQKNADRLDSLIRQIDSAAKEEEKEFAKEKTLSGPEYLTQANLRFYQDIVAPPPPSQPVPAEQPDGAEPREESLESLSAAEDDKDKRVFSSDDERAPAVAPVQPRAKQRVPTARSAPQQPYNPFGDQSKAHSAGGSNNNKKHQGKQGHGKLAPLLYDPMNPGGAGTQPEAKMNVDSEPGAVYKIWTGTLENGRMLMNCDMYTNEDVALYYKVPAFSSRISIDGRGKVPDVTRYLYTKRAKLQSRVLKGWVSPEPEARVAMERYADELEKADKCGVIDIKELGCCVYLIPWTTRNSAFIQSWDIFPIGDMSLVKFAYFFALKHLERLSAYRTLQPVPVKRVVEDTPAVVLKEKPEKPHTDGELAKKEESQPKEPIATVQAEPSSGEKRYVNLTPADMMAYYGKERVELGGAEGSNYMKKVQNLQNFVERNKQAFLVFMKSFMSSNPAAPAVPSAQSQYAVFPPLAAGKADLLIENMKCSGKL